MFLQALNYSSTRLFSFQLGTAQKAAVVVLVLLLVVCWADDDLARYIKSNRQGLVV